MKKLITKLLTIIGILSFTSCADALCNCKSACTVTEKGQISCSLDEKALEKRKAIFHKTFTSKAEKVEETENGYQFRFKDEGKLNEQLFKFILTEKKCCPFFQYDLKVLPYNEGIHLTVSGDKDVKAFLKTLILIKET